MYARYTTVLKDLMDNSETSKALEKALSTYPLYEPTTKSIIPERSELNQRLLNAYKYREIGFETVGRFLDELEITMNEIMPYYNEMYKTIEIMAELENPFDNVDFIETYSETRNGTETDEKNATTTNEASRTSNDEGEITTSNTANNTTSTTDNSTTTSNVNNTSKNVHSETPQNSLTITAENINSVDYADDVTWNKSNNTDSASTNGEGSSSSNSTSEQTTSSTNTNTTDESGTLQTDESGTRTTKDTIEHTFQKKGNQGVNTYAHDMIEFRQSIIDITNRIINDDRINELFMRVF